MDSPQPSDTKLLAIMPMQIELIPLPNTAPPIQPKSQLKSLLQNKVVEKTKLVLAVIENPRLVKQPESIEPIKTFLKKKSSELTKNLSQ